MLPNGCMDKGNVIICFSQESPLMFNSMAYFYVISCYMISKWRSPFRDHLADTNFLYKIVLSVNLQEIHQINIKYLVCNKNNNKLVFNPSVENSLIVFGRDIWLILWIHQIYLRKNNSCVLHKQIEHLFVLVIGYGILQNVFPLRILCVSFIKQFPQERKVPCLHSVTGYSSKLVFNPAKCPILW